MNPTPTGSPEPFPHDPVPPELLAYARQTLDLEAEMRDIRELQATGGVPFEQIIAEVEAIVRGS